MPSFMLSSAVYTSSCVAETLRKITSMYFSESRNKTRSVEWNVTTTPSSTVFEKQPSVQKTSLYALRHTEDSELQCAVNH